MDGAIASGLVLTALHATPDLAAAAHALEGRPALLGGVTQAGSGDFIGLVFVHAGPVDEAFPQSLWHAHFNCMTLFNLVLLNTCKTIYIVYIVSLIHSTVRKAGL